uniref:Epidermal growth factor receptor substrate 15-like 1 n=1 Tax=Schistocephalus solidus TaxID=70667 RepID=A0A183SLD5_SCHSO
LRKIWDLSDLDRDGSLDRFEFILTMHLVCRRLEGDAIPSVLPTNLIPPNKRGAASEPLALMPPPMASPDFNSIAIFSAGSYKPTSSAFPSPNPAYLGGPPPPMPEWSITAAQLAQYSPIFANLDQDVDGLVTGAEVREFFLRSRLPQLVLARIWDLVDLQGTGTLNQEQFAVAMHLANEQLASNCAAELPATLPPALIPPSLRPVTLEPSAYEEANKLIAEIEKTRRERMELEAECMKLKSDSQLRAVEFTKVQTAEETLLQTTQRLAAQRASAEKWVVNSVERRDGLQTSLTAVSSRVAEERSRVEDLRHQAATQQISIKTQEEEVARLRAEISEGHHQKKSLSDRIAERQERLKVVEAENRSISSTNDQRQSAITNLESLRRQLQNALQQYDRLLAGDSSVGEPDEVQIDTLQLSESDHPITKDASDVSPFNPRFPTVMGGSRENGASSVPLFPMSPDESSALGAPSQSASEAKSALAFPISDPFDFDSFNAAFNSGNAFSEASDPFAPVPSSANSVRDPFLAGAIGDGNNDLFDNKAPQPTFDSSKFDAVFGSAPSAQSTSYAFPTGSHAETYQKKIPPPRPSTQPSLGRKKSTGDAFASGGSGTSGKSSQPHTIDSPGKLSKLRGVLSSKRSESSGASATAKSSSKHNSSFSTLPRSGRRGHSGQRSTSISITPTTSSSLMPSGLTEEEQLLWAKVDSQLCAKREETLRQQEEAELQRALQLSLLESTRGH